MPGNAGGPNVYNIQQQQPSQQPAVAIQQQQYQQQMSYLQPYQGIFWPWYWINSHLTGKGVGAIAPIPLKGQLQGRDICVCVMFY